MDIIEKKTIDMLTVNSVSIATDKFVEIDGQEQKVGERHRISYQNSVEGRDNLQKEQPEDVVSAVMAIWGDDPTVDDSMPDMSVLSE